MKPAPSAQIGRNPDADRGGEGGSHGAGDPERPVPRLFLATRAGAIVIQLYWEKLSPRGRPLTVLDPPPTADFEFGCGFMSFMYCFSVCESSEGGIPVSNSDDNTSRQENPNS